MRCSICDSENSPDAHYCENCGQPLSRRCPVCGKETVPQAKFCKHCGASLAPAPHSLEEDETASFLSPGEEATIARQTVSHLASLQRSAPPALQERMRQASAEIEGERKPVTILFTDIVGSIAHAEHLDPEDWREIVSGAHRIVSEAVYHYEGTIAQLLGDGVLAFFGAPITHEDDPLRAVRAALDIQARIADYALKITAALSGFQVRIGINSGTVVVGNIGHDMHMEYLAVGDAVNLAARMQSAAEPGKILITGQMQHILQHAVELEDLGEISVKGRVEPVHVYQVEGLLHTQRHGHSLSGMESPLVGREMELEALQQASSAVQAGLGRVAVLVGEPGLGKSRLLAEWRAASSGKLRIIQGSTLSYGQGLPYHLLLDMLRNLLGAAPSAGEAEVNRLLAALVAENLGTEDVETYAFLGHLLSLQLSSSAQQVVRGLDPLTLRTQYIAALQRLLLALAGHQPLALIFEDTHWADQASVEVINKLLLLAREAALFFLFTSRPEQDVPGWLLVTTARNTFGAGLLELNLKPLSTDEVQRMTANLLSADSLPSGLQALVSGKSEGNPLFVEELISALIEAGILERRNGHLVAIGDLSKVEIPDNLKRLMLARIDRLAEEPKRTLRVAAVIGRDFLVRLLDAVLAGVDHPQTRPRLLAQLSTLEATSLITLAATQPEIGYLFRHALVQEAAYEALLKTDRRRLHQAAAIALEQLYPDRVNELAATLAYHYERAQDHRHALQYLELAADGARHKYANAEAIALYRAAIEAASSLTNAGETGGEQLADLFEKLGSVQLLIGLHEAGRQAFQEALDRTPAEQPLARARRQRQIGNGWMLPREYGKALEAFDLAAQEIDASQMQRETMVNQVGEDSVKAESMTELSDWRNEWLNLQLDRLWALYWMNDIPGMEESIQLIQPEIESYGSAKQRSVFYGRLVTLALRRDRYVISDEILQYARLTMQLAEQAASQSGDLNNLMLSPFILGFCYLWRGELGEAENYLYQGLELAERTGDQEQRVLMLAYLVVVYRYQCNLARMQQFTPLALQAAQEARMPPYIGIALANQAWLSLQFRDYKEAETLAKESFSYVPAMFPHYAVIAWVLIAIHLPLGETAEAVEAARKMLAPSQRKLPDPIEPSLLSAVHAFDLGDSAEAVKRLELALSLAKEYQVF